MAPLPASEFRAVMIGKSNADNTTLCQLINGQKNIFHQKIQKHSRQSKSNLFTVELTEDVFSLPLNTVRHKMKKCVAQCHPGPNVLLLLVQASDFTEKDRKTLKFILNLFGQEAWKHLMIVETENDTRVNSSVNQLLQDCGHRQHTLNFDKQGFSDCIQELLDKMGEIVFATRGQYLNFTEEAEVTGPECTQDKEQVPKVRVPGGNSFTQNMPPKPVPPPRRHSLRNPEGNKHRNLAGMQRMVPGRQSLRQSHSEQSVSTPISRESYGKIPGQESARVFRDQEYTRKVKPKEPVRIVMVGKTGCGKSATGNTILGRNCFDASPCLSSVTKICQKEEGEIGGRRITVVDTPGLFDTTLTNIEIQQELGKCVSLLAPGPHVFLLVIQIGRVTREERDTVDVIRKFFGKKSEDFIILLFTRGDELGGQTIESYLAGDTKGFMKNLVNQCGGRYLVFNNKDEKNNIQVHQLMEKIDVVVKANNGSCYNSDMFKEAEAAIQQETQKILKDKEEEIQKEVKEVERRHQEEKREQQKRWTEIEKREEEERNKKEQVKKKREVFGNKRTSVHNRFSMRSTDGLEEQEAWKQKVKVRWEKQRREDEERQDQQELQENHEQEIKMHENKQKEDRIRQEERERELKEIQQRNEMELEEIRRRHEEEARKQAEESNKFSEEIYKYGKEIETLKRRHQQQREKLIDQLCKNQHFKKSFTKLKDRQQQEVNEMKLTHFDDRTNLDKFLSDQKAVHEDEIDDWVEEHVNLRGVCSIL